MKKSIILLFHIGFWVCFIFLLLLLIGIYFQGEVPEDKLAYYFQILLGLYNTVGPEEDYTWECFILPMIFMTTLAAIAETVALLIRGFLTWFEEIKLKEALQKKNHEMEMALVKAQLDPHFLFNTINNIDVLILKDAEEASHYLNKLSDIMRFMLFETKTTAIPLAKELKYIEKYIALQKIRTTNKNYVDYSVKGIVNGQTIAPMVFIPFIENAFKHTNNKKLEDAITVQIEVAQATIKMICKNKIDPSRKTKIESNGLGNELIEKRLHLIYPNRHELSITHENNLYTVVLTINN